MFTSDRDKLFYSKLDDAKELSFLRGKPYFFSFLSERRQAMARRYFEQRRFDDYAFWGGYESAQRKLLCVHSGESVENEDFPVCALEFKFRKCDNLTHRDFLGALMSLGLERETVGDILVEEGRAVVFLKSEIREYVSSQIFKIGSAGVSVSESALDALPVKENKQQLSFTVSSLRLDNIVAAICALSREKTKTLIMSGSVSVNYVECKNVSLLLQSGASIIIRGKGKYILEEILGNTKKGRVKISVTHFR